MFDIRDTVLFKRLQRNYEGSEKLLAETLAMNLSALADEAATRMKAVVVYMPEYTLHDDAHLLNVIHLMGRLIPPQTLDRLNPIEVALLILSSCYHDQGMVIDAHEFATLEKEPRFVIFRENWEIDHPNYRKLCQRSGDRSLSDTARQKLIENASVLRAAMLSDYIRETHGRRSADYVKQHLGDDKRLQVESVNLSDLLARLCHSHVRPLMALRSELRLGFDDRIGEYNVNSIYLALVLRLADLLDFDRERTPDSLFQSIHFESEISLREWEKHRAVTGWEISPTRIRFTMDCVHPAYQRAAFQFMDYIDVELYAISGYSHEFPTHTSGYELPLPLKVDRDRIHPRDDSYIYYDLEFSLSRNEIVQLLMTDQLYSKPYLCIRELLQNALDALRYRKALRGRERVAFEDGKVSFEHVLDAQGNQIVRCVDNGVGMDEDQIIRFLTKAGRSYYHSPEFEHERLSFKAANVDFNPCARFGIGFMSCFMFGDKITVYTRRDYGIGRQYGKPYIVEIDGVGGILTLRLGPTDQPVGTTVEIFLRETPPFFSDRTDPVHLTEVLYGYTIGAEFPVEARRTLPGLDEHLLIPSGIRSNPTLLEQHPDIPSVTIRQEFAEVDARLSGEMHESFLIDDQDNIVLANSVAHYVPADYEVKPERDGFISAQGGTSVQLGADEHNNIIAFDGILVSGHAPARRRPDFLTRYGLVVGIETTPYVLDVRGDLKAELTPARTPPENRFRDPDHSWLQLDRLIRRSRGLIWATVISKLCPDGDATDFWQLAVYHEFDPTSLPIGIIWSKVRFPVEVEPGQIQWCFLHDFGKWILKGERRERFLNPMCSLIRVDGARLGQLPSVRSNRGHHRTSIQDVIIRLGDIESSNSGPLLVFSQPENEAVTVLEWRWSFEYSWSSFNSHRYGGEYRDCLYVEIPVGTANRRHVVTQSAQQFAATKVGTLLQEFAAFLIIMLNSLEFHDYLRGDLKEPWHGVKMLGHKFLAVDWSGVAQDYHPPYKIWLEKVNFMTIGPQHFVEWANINIPPN